MDGNLRSVLRFLVHGSPNIQDGRPETVQLVTDQGGVGPWILTCHLRNESFGNLFCVTIDVQRVRHVIDAERPVIAMLV